MPDEFSGFPTGYPYGTTPPPTTYSQGAGQGGPSTTPYYPYQTGGMGIPGAGGMGVPGTGGMGTSGMSGTGAPGAATGTPGGGPGATSPAPSLPLPAQEQSYIENILRMNKDKEVTAYMTFEHGAAGESKAFTGTIEAAGRDHLILKETATGIRYLLPLIYLDYVQFQGVVNYAYPYRRSY